MQIIGGIKTNNFAVIKITSSNENKLLLGLGIHYEYCSIGCKYCQP